MAKKLLIIFSISLIIILLLPFPSSAKAEKVTIEATVDEHLSYLKKDDKLTFSTNSFSGLLIKNGDAIFRINRPTESIINFKTDEPDSACGGASEWVLWQSCSSAVSVGLHSRQKQDIQAIPNKLFVLVVNF